MKAQTPAKGISQTASYPDARSYKIECECSDRDHAVDMWIEVDGDPDTKDVEVGFYVDTWTPVWDSGFSRVKTAWNVLLKGVNRQEHHIILSKQAALNLAKVVEQTVKRLDSQ
jgi:hypothetical protein